VKSWSVVSALQDLGMVVVASATKKSTEEDKARIRELMGPDAKMIEDGSARALLTMMAELNADIMIAGGRNLYTALKARLPFLDINQEREFGYAGYSGMLELVKQLALTIESPIWQSVRAPAPWVSTQPAKARADEPLDEDDMILPLDDDFDAAAGSFSVEAA
jgi:nitrogenase molybdenum-cofactor synthesis protein NifE